jgi:hypothetical protein
MRWNQLAKLTEHTEFACGWFGISFFHLRRVTELKSHANHFFSCSNPDSYGMALFIFRGISEKLLRLLDLGGYNGLRIVFLLSIIKPRLTTVHVKGWKSIDAN